MMTGKVLALQKAAGRARIRPEGWSEDLLTESIWDLLDAPSSLEVGQMVCFRVDEGPQGRRASQVLVIPRVNLQIEERTIGGPESIERVLVLDSERVAVAYLDHSCTRGILAWPLFGDAGLESVLDLCNRALFLPYHETPKRLEFWIDDDNYEATLGTQINVRSVVEIIEAQLNQNAGDLSVMQIHSEEVSMELLFDPITQSPVRLTLIILKINLETLIGVFCNFHKNHTIRDYPGISVYAFSPSSQNYLDPLVVL